METLVEIVLRKAYSKRQRLHLGLYRAQRYRCFYCARMLRDHFIPLALGAAVFRTLLRLAPDGISKRDGNPDDPCHPFKSIFMA
jgi:hypothetical protein